MRAAAGGGSGRRLEQGGYLTESRIKYKFQTVVLSMRAKISQQHGAPCEQNLPRYSGTAARIINVAEVLFVEFGLQATSLRLITQQAGVNLAAVNYHFRSKDALFAAVFTRRFAPWACACLRELDTLEERAAAGAAHMSVEEVVMCYVRPTLALSRDPARGGAMFARLFSRVLVENHRQLRQMLADDWGHMVTRFTQALAHALPALGAEEVIWRLHVGFSVMFHAFAGNDILKVFGRSVVSARDPDLIVKYVVPFVVAGMSASAGTTHAVRNGLVRTQGPGGRRRAPVVKLRAVAAPASDGGGSEGNGRRARAVTGTSQVSRLRGAAPVGTRLKGKS